MHQHQLFTTLESSLIQCKFILCLQLESCSTHMRAPHCQCGCKVPPNRESTSSPCPPVVGILHKRVILLATSKQPGLAVQKHTLHCLLATDVWCHVPSAGNCYEFIAIKMLLEPKRITPSQILLLPFLSVNAVKVLPWQLRTIAPSPGAPGQRSWIWG